MNPHLKVVSWLHIVAAALGLAFIGVLWWAAAGLQPLFAGTFIPELVAWVGKPFAIGVILLLALEGAAGVALLCGARRARHVLVVMGVLHLWAFPIGTALAVYTAWAAWGRPSGASSPN